ncbi:MAG: hypothetical protein M3Y66_05860 [Actinomycetota bacterium]|nr:hypothetical protein [Actinomycetota bacterium]
MGSHPLHPVGECFDRVFVGERLPHRRCPSEEKPGVHAGLVETVELAGQVEYILPTQLGPADRLGDVLFPALD